MPFGVDDAIMLGKLATGAYSAISGLFKKGQAKKLAEKNVRPTEVVPDEVKINTQMAKDLAQQGLPAAQYQQAIQEIQKSSAAATAASADRRGGLSTVGAIQQQTQDAKNRLTAEDAAARMGNIKNLMARNDVMAQWKDKVWDYNERQKYEENAAAIRALAGSGAEEGNIGLNALLGGLATGATGTGSIPQSIARLFQKKQTRVPFSVLPAGVEAD